MAPRASQQRRTLGPPTEHIYELGVAGRKTGVTLKDTGIRDEHGMEPIDALFSSPRKEASDDGSGSGDDGSGEDMDITTTSGIGPAALLNGHTTRLPMPLPRVRSPVKTSLNSPAQRNRLLARSSSPTHGSGIRGGAVHSSSQSTRDPSTAKRRLDFSSLQAGAKALSQPLPVNGAARRHAAPATRPSQQRRGPYDEESDDEEQHQQAEHAGEEEDIESFVEESIVMLSGGDDDDMVDLPQANNDSSAQEEEEPSQATAATKRKPGRKPKTTESPRAAKTGKKPVRRMEESEAEEEDGQDANLSEDEEAEEVQEVAAKPQQTGPGKRGRPAKNKAVPSKESPAQPPSSEPRSKKRRSLNEDVEAAEGSAGRKMKRPRAEAEPAPPPTPPPAPAAAPRGRGRQAKKAAALPGEAVAPKKEKTPASDSASAPAKRGRKRKSSIGDTSAVLAPRGPPLPRSRGLVINRRETPDDANNSRTRSGRTSYKPLAFWRNERVEFEEEEVDDNFAPKSRAVQFVLPSIREIVRVDEPEPDYAGSGSHRRPRAGGKKKKKGDSDDGLADAWELNPGAVEGEVSVWYPEYERNPPAADDEVEVTERQLAISARAIRTAKVKNASFKFAKTVSEGFFGAGVVDMPPGSIKNQKNSRKMFMTFFVFTGKVLVSVGESSFRISKGGMWFVPRGNYYSIENDYDQPARLFFSQGCEVAARSQSESAEPEPSMMMGEEAGGAESQNES